MASPDSGKASLDALGGYPGDGTESAVVRRWIAPDTMRINVSGALNHQMGAQSRRFRHSNGVRGWIISSERGALATWTVKGFEAETTIRNLDVSEGELLDFAVDSLGDYEADGFTWSPQIEEVLTEEQRQSGAEPRAWSAEQGFPPPGEEPLSPVEQYAQILLMTNEFAFLD